jgi:hypothetical protein
MPKVAYRILALHTITTTLKDQRRVRVPADMLVDLRGGHCVCVDRARSALDRQGWEI